MKNNGLLVDSTGKNKIIAPSLEKFGFSPRMYIAVRHKYIIYLLYPYLYVQTEANLGNEAAWVSHLISNYRNCYTIRDEKGRIGVKTMVFLAIDSIPKPVLIRHSIRLIWSQDFSFYSMKIELRSARLLPWEPMTFIPTHTSHRKHCSSIS